MYHVPCLELYLQHQLILSAFLWETYNSYSVIRKWKSLSRVQLCNPMEPARLLCPQNSPGKNPGVGSHSLLQGNLPNPGIECRFPALQAGSLPSEPPEKPKNTGVGSLSLLHGIFPIQESNQCLLHCRQVLYQLSYQGRSPVIRKLNLKTLPREFPGHLVVTNS